MTTPRHVRHVRAPFPVQALLDLRVDLRRGLQHRARENARAGLLDLRAQLADRREADAAVTGDRQRSADSFR